MDTEQPVRDEAVTLDGLRFHYRDWGDPAAPSVVLLHSYTQHARSWEPVQLIQVLTLTAFLAR